MGIYLNKVKLKQSMNMLRQRVRRSSRDVSGYIKSRYLERVSADLKTYIMKAYRDYGKKQSRHQR